MYDPTSAAGPRREPPARHAVASQGDDRAPPTPPPRLGVGDAFERVGRDVTVEADGPAATSPCGRRTSPVERLTARPREHAAWMARSMFQRSTDGRGLPPGRRIVATRWPRTLGRDGTADQLVPSAHVTGGESYPPARVDLSSTLPRTSPPGRPRPRVDGIVRRRARRPAPHVDRVRDDGSCPQRPVHARSSDRAVGEGDGFGTAPLSIEGPGAPRRAGPRVTVRRVARSRAPRRPLAPTWSRTPEPLDVRRLHQQVTDHRRSPSDPTPRPGVQVHPLQDLAGSTAGQRQRRRTRVQSREGAPLRARTATFGEGAAHRCPAPEARAPPARLCR